MVAPPRIPADPVWGETGSTGAATVAPAGGRRAWGPPVTAPPTFVSDELEAPIEGQQAQLGAAQQQRAALSHRIEVRAARLEEMWREVPPSKRAEALRHYRRHSARLADQPVSVKTRVADLETKAQDEEAKVASLGKEFDSQCKPESQECTPDETKKQIETAAALATARLSLDQTLESAVQVIDGHGLKVDRLAVTEKIIDPNATGESLLEMQEQLVKLDELIKDLTQFVKQVEEEAKKQAELRRRVEEDNRRGRRVKDQTRKAAVKLAIKRNQMK